jgi:hypothetical protein
VPVRAELPFGRAELTSVRAELVEAPTNLRPNVSSLTDWITALASAVSAGGVVFAVIQLRLTKRIHQRQFEDSLAKEYRDLISRIPTKALLGSGLSPSEFEECFDELFRYIDLSNEQVALRRCGRVSDEVWESWASGIKFNLGLPAFRKAWEQVRHSNTGQFEELQRAAGDGLALDPFRWGRRAGR